MKKYRVHFTDTASRDAEAAYDWIAERAPRAATKWFNGLLAIVRSLESMPLRCVIARESANVLEEIRQLLYGRRPHVYRVLFICRGEDVYVLHIRHSKQDSLAPEDIRFPNRKD